MAPGSSADAHVIFGPGAADRMATAVAARLGVACGRVEYRPFERGEHKSRALDDVEGRQVAVIAALYGELQQPSANDRLMQLLLFIGGLRDAGAGGIIVVAPYLPYLRKDRRTRSRDPLNCRYVAQLLEAAGADRLVVVEPHNLPAFENAFRIPTVPLPLAPLLADWVNRLPADEQLCVISPDVGGVKRAQQLHALLRARGRATGNLAFFEKRRTADTVTGGTLVGDVSAAHCLIVDDLIASGGTLARAARACREAGALSVTAAAAHALLVPESVQLAEARLDRLLLTDSIPVDPALAGRLPLGLLPLAPYLAQCLRCLWFGASLAELMALDDQ